MFKFLRIFFVDLEFNETLKKLDKALKDSDFYEDLFRGQELSNDQRRCRETHMIEIINKLKEENERLSKRKSKKAVAKRRK